MADLGEPAIMADPPLMVTAGALGNEDRSSRRRKKDKSGRSKSRKGRDGHKKRRSAARQALAPPIFDTAPLAPKENLAGRVSRYIRDVLGVKRSEIKTAKPYHQVNFTTEPTITFEIRSNKNEFIRFKPDSLSVVYYGNYLNPNRVAASPNPETAAERHSLRAQELHPAMFLDPSVMGTGFFHKVEVLIDNVPCTTNSDLNSLLLHYNRCARVFCANPPSPYFATDADLTSGNPLPAVMAAGAEPFAANAWNSTEGYRMPIYLEGVFPFDLKNRTLESIDHREDPHLYFPPDTCISIKLHAYRTKMEAIWHPELADKMGDYWNRDAAVNNFDALGLRFTLLDALLSYESVQLHPNHHVELMQAYRSGGLAQYDYDRVCGQYCPLLNNLSITENRFQIDPFARLIYVLFLPDYAVFPIDALRRPLSALTRFPAGNTSMTVSFASEENLIHERLENFGVPGRRVDASKHIYWQKLKESRITNASFEQLFPKLATEYSVIQALVMDLRNHSSRKTENLILRMEFAGGTRSPNHQQIVVLSVHPTGQLQCSLDNSTGRWVWNFANRTYDGI